MLCAKLALSPSMSLVQKFGSGLKGLKVNEVPEYAKKFQGDHLQSHQIRSGPPQRL